MAAVLVFDLETVPDVDGMHKLWGQPDETPLQTFERWRSERKAAGSSDFAPLHLQRVYCISVLFRHLQDVKIHSFVDADGHSEGKVIQQFFASIERHTPQLVSWNGGGFDLPVLHYRAMVHGVQASKYWDLGDGGDYDSKDFKWNNYISRYHHRHLDLMDLLALYQPKANAPLDAMAKLCGFAGKLGMDGSQVFDAVQQGRGDEVRRYCETDVVNTYLLYCRFQLMRGGFSPQEYADEVALVRKTLERLEKPFVDDTDTVSHTASHTASQTGSHWQAYLQAWPETAAT